MAKFVKRKHPQRGEKIHVAFGGYVSAGYYLGHEGNDLFMYEEDREEVINGNAQEVEIYDQRLLTAKERAVSEKIKNTVRCPGCSEFTYDDRVKKCESCGFSKSTSE